MGWWSVIILDLTSATGYLQPADAQLVFLVRSVGLQGGYIPVPFLAWPCAN